MAVKDAILGLGDSFESAMSSASALGQAAGGFIRKGNSILSGDYRTPNSIRDILTNGFLSNNSIFKPQYFIRAFDEPTYLTFRIEFMMEPHELDDRNVTVNNIGVNGEQSSHIYFNTIYDYMPEPFLENFSTVGSVDTSIGKKYSTERYLDYSLGDHVRASLLHNFKLALKDIQDNFPFYFKSISGLNTLTQVNTASGIRLKDAKISLSCLEGLDLKITQLINMYRKIVWDDTYQRWVLPDMMRYFGMRIYISEIRNFHEYRRKNDPSDSLMGDFSLQDTRNATTFPMQKQNAWQTINNAVNTATAVSSAYLGTKNIISQAVEKTANVFTTVNDVAGGIINALNETYSYNNAINAIMPTICYECHMCEFDIADTMGHIESLASNTNESSSPTPTISIKVGQVKEIADFPLNATLYAGNDGKYRNKDGRTLRKSLKSFGVPANSEAIKSFEALESARNNPNELMFTGNFMSDALLTKRYMNANTKNGNELDNRIDEMIQNIYSAKGKINEAYINERRLPKQLQDAIDKDRLAYNTQTITESLSHLSLTAALLNEATSDIEALSISSTATNPTQHQREMMESIKPRLDNDENAIQRSTTNQHRSKALNQSSELKSSMQSIRDTMLEAAERIYNSKDLNSLAISEQQKAKIADGLYDEFIKNLDNSTATENTLLKSFLNNYKEIKVEQETSKATSKENTIKNFSILN